MMTVRTTGVFYIILLGLLCLIISCAGDSVSEKYGAIQGYIRPCIDGYNIKGRLYYKKIQDASDYAPFKTGEMYHVDFVKSDSTGYFYKDYLAVGDYLLMATGGLSVPNEEIKYHKVNGQEVARVTMAPRCEEAHILEFRVAPDSISLIDVKLKAVSQFLYIPGPSSLIIKWNENIIANSKSM